MQINTLKICRNLFSFSLFETGWESESGNYKGRQDSIHYIAGLENARNTQIALKLSISIKNTKTKIALKFTKDIFGLEQLDFALSVFLFSKFECCC